MTKNLVALTFAAAAAVTSTPAAAAKIGSPAWGCVIEAKLANSSAVVGAGFICKHGPADVKCAALENAGSRKPPGGEVYVEITGPAIGLDLNFVRSQKVYMGTTTIGIRDARDLLGTHSLSIGANANVLFLAGGLQAGVEFSDRMIGVKPSIEVSHTPGLGATLSIQKMTVYRDKKAYLKAKARPAAA